MKPSVDIEELFSELIKNTFPQLEVMCVKNGVFYINIKNSVVCILVDRTEFTSWKKFRQAVCNGIEDALRNFKDLEKN